MSPMVWLCLSGHDEITRRHGERINGNDASLEGHDKYVLRVHGHGYGLHANVKILYVHCKCIPGNGKRIPIRVKMYHVHDKRPVTW
jgi:hypothetical protein